MRVALGLKARTGHAVLVAVGGNTRAPQFVARSEMRLLPEGAFAPYHAAKELDPADAKESIECSIASAHELAAIGIREAVTRLRQTGHEVCACGMFTGTGMPTWTTEEILAVHVRMHKAEGELFRDVLVAGVRACGMEPTTLPEKTALDGAAKMLGIARAELDERLAVLGRVAGPPWGKDQKEAAAAALAAFEREHRGAASVASLP